jgi:hypothetical protein
MISYTHTDGTQRSVPEDCPVLHTARKKFTFNDVQEADQSIDVDFDGPLPDGAVVVGAGIKVKQKFDNAGETAGVTADVGIKGGDRDAFCDGASLSAAGSVGSPAGVGMGTLVGAITPSVLVVPDVNGNTLTMGDAEAIIVYTVV